LSGDLLKDPSKRVKGKTNDPVPIIHNHLCSLLRLEEMGEGPKDYLELLIREMRSTSLKDIEQARRVHHRLLSDSRAMLDAITGEGDRTREVIDLLLALILSHLVRIEMFSAWSDPAIGTWDELRIERQRSIKGEIGSLLDLALSLNRIHRAILQRIDAYRSNMRVRSGLSWSSKGILSSSTRAPAGDLGEEWRGSIRIDMGKGSSGSIFVPHIRLPAPSWTMVAPLSTRDGNEYTLEPVKCKDDGSLVLDISVSSPPDPGSGPVMLIHLIPPETRLEVEP
jgi:hypothetical protein